MSKNFNDRILKDVNAIYSYILSQEEIKNLTKSIIKLIKIKKNNKKIFINEKNFILFIFSDNIKSNKTKSLKVLTNFLKTYIKKL